MKKYNFKKAKELIEKYKDTLESASLGMHEDWFWTAETIYENGEYKRELPDNADEIYKSFTKAREEGMSLLSEEVKPFRDSILIAGIYSSYWATPTLQLEFKDGTDKMIPCHDDGETDGESPLGELGVLSASVQDGITPLTEE